MMMVSMPMRSLLIAIVCGGTGDSIILGAGILLGTIVAGITVLGILTTTIMPIGIRDIIITIIRIMQV
jgi:hypothetical protein